MSSSEPFHGQTTEPDVGSTSPDTERSPRTASALIKLRCLAFCIGSLQLHLVHNVLFLLCFETPQKNHSAAGKKDGKALLGVLVSSTHKSAESVRVHICRKTHKEAEF